jgi:hypothetical protein
MNAFTQIFASLAVSSAFAILNLTIFRLPDSASSRNDVVTDGITRVSGIVAFAFSGSIFMALLIAFVLCWAGTGGNASFRVIAIVALSGMIYYRAQRLQCNLFRIARF